MAAQPYQRGERSAFKRCSDHFADCISKWHNGDDRGDLAVLPWE